LFNKPEEEIRRMVESETSVAQAIGGGSRHLWRPSAVAAAGPAGLRMIVTVGWLLCGSGVNASEVNTFYCAGSEPLWEMSVQAGEGRFGTILDGARSVTGVPEPAAGGEPGWRGRASDDVELLLRFEAGACATPLLNGAAQHRALLVIGGAARLSGCCRLALDGVPVADGARPSEPRPAPSGMVARVRAEPGNMVNVRARPAMVRGNVVTKLPAGASIQVAGAGLHDGDLWYRVQLPDAADGGWIKGDLVELVAVPSDEARDSWDMSLELIPAIDRCLEQITTQPALITKASRDATGVVAVRLMDAEGRRWACSGDRNGSATPHVTPVQSGERLSGEFRPLFLRAPDEPTRNPCYRHEPLQDRTGQIVGWLSFGLCS
jgi:uncharacterized membrane protein